MSTLKLATTSGLSWRTIRNYTRSPLLERDRESDEPKYVHRKQCHGQCGGKCNGDKGDMIAADIGTDECWFPDED